MTRILLVETAAPARVRRKAEEILRGGIHADPEITILCSEDPAAIRYFTAIPGAEVVSLTRENRGQVLEGMRRRRFDVAYTFWTGEKRYRGMKLAALQIGAGRTQVDVGDGYSFRLTWKAFIRFWLFRLRHSLPSDHCEFVPQARRGETARDHYPGERVLVLQSAGPDFVLAAMNKLEEQPVFRSPRYTLFCRNLPDVVGRFTGHALLHEIRLHTRTRKAWHHLRQLRAERFDAAVLFLTGERGYWKVKCFAFLLGTRHKLVFNENIDCFHFTIRAWLSLVVHRFAERSRPGIEPQWPHWARAALITGTKLALLPFRFAWLILVWLRLRHSGAGNLESES